MSLEEKIVALDEWIDQFITQNFSKEDINNVKPHLIDYIKNDKNVIAFSAKKDEKLSEDAEFALTEFIKKACDKYYKQVMAYKLSYFNGEDAEQLSKKLIDEVLDRFYDGMDYHLSEFLEEHYPNLSSSSVSKIKEIFSDRKDIKSSLKDDEHVIQHARIFLDSSPYELSVLLLLEEMMEGLAKLAFFEILKASPEMRKIIDVETKTNASQCLNHFFKPADSESEKASTEVILGKGLG